MSGKLRTFADEIVDTGEFKRGQTSFRNWISKSHPVYKPAPGRYHLYVAWACPWACRTLAVRNLKGLQDVIGFSVVHWLLDFKDGWKFSPEEGYIDKLNPETKLLRELYFKTDPNYTNKVTVPVLWDNETKTIVNNESAEIIQMFNSEFNEWAKNPELDLNPEDLRKEMAELDEWVYDAVNNGVYRAGFASKQGPYEKAYNELFAALDRLEDILGKKRYLFGDRLTLSDVRLWTTLIRFDSVYHNHFKCNRNTLREMPNLWGYTRELYQMPALKDTVNMEDIKKHYYGSHTNINPTRVVPVGPVINYDEPHGRDKREYSGDSK